MSERKKTIVVDTKGISEFVSGLESASKEIKQIEAEFKKLGIPENQLKAQAVRYRNEMIAATKAIEVARNKAFDKEEGRIKRLARASGGVGKEALGIFIGGEIGETFSIIQQGLSQILEGSKDSDKDLKNLSNSLDSVVRGAKSFGLAFLKFISKPLSKFIKVASATSKLLFGISFEAEKGSEKIQKLKTSFNEQIEVLKEGNISQEARTQLIKDINKQYGEYLPNLLNEKSSIEEITAAQIEGNKALDAKFFKLASEEVLIENSSKRLKLLKEEVDLQRELTKEQTELQKRLERIDKRNISERQLTQFNLQKSTVSSLKQQIELNKENLSVLEDESETIKSIAKEQGVTLDTTINLKEPVSKPFKKKGDKLTVDVQANVDLKNSTDSLNRVQEEIQSDIDKAIQEGQLANAKKLLEELKDLRKEFESQVSDLSQSKKRQVELDRNVLSAKANLKEVESVFNELEFQFNRSLGLGNLTEQLRQDATFDKLPQELKDKFKAALSSQGGLDLFTLFETESLSGEAADKLFAQVASKTNTLRENIEALSNVGITSPLFEEILKRQEEFANAQFEAQENANSITKDGIDVSKQRAQLNEAILKSETEILKKSDDLNKSASKAAANVFINNRKLLEQLGSTEIIDSFLSKTAEFELANQAQREEIKKTEELLKAVEGDDGLTEKYTKVLQGQRKVLENTQKLQQIELENLGTEFAETELNAFRVRFKEEKSILELSLREQEFAIRSAKEELETDRKRFDARAERDQREYNEKEIDIITEQTENILDLETNRFDTEKKLRVGAIVEALGDIEKRGGDVDTLLKKYNLDEEQIVYDHNKNIVGIIEEGSIEIKEARVKAFITEEEALSLFNTALSSFGQVYDAFLSYQTSLGEAVIESITTQLDFINNEISESTSNLSALQDDLEGKQEGRREALLRGIEVEKERNDSLVDEKIKAEERLAAEERKQAIIRKEQSISQALINGALAATGTWAGYASLGVAGTIAAGIQTGVIAATTALQIAEIENQTFADGGMLDFGKSHAQGGISFTVDGETGFEAEKGEAIINKRSVAMFKPLLSQINVAGGGKSFQNGSVLGANFVDPSLGAAMINKNDIMALLKREIFVSVTEIENLQNKKAIVTERGSI